jgi:acyl-CoA synthetase (AMP-forming)/AMP-acid ligase II
MPTELYAAPEVASTLPDLLHRAVDHSGDSGVMCGATRWGYADIDSLSDRLARALIRAGVAPGDRVVTLLPNCPEFLLAAFAVWKARSVFVPEFTGIPPIALARILADARPAALIMDQSVAERLEDMTDSLRGIKTVFVKDRTCELSDVDGITVESLNFILESDAGSKVSLPTGGTSKEVASITYTSGSMGTPKGVMHSHESWLAAAEFTRDFVGIYEHDVIVIPLPLHHGLAFRHMLAYFLANATVIIAVDIYEALKALRERRPSALLLVPSACHIAIDHFAPVLRQATSHLRYVEIGAAAMSAERLRKLQELLPETDLHVPYGLTEARVGYLKPGRDGRFSRIDCTSPGLSVSVVHRDGSTVGPGETGEIVIRGRGLMLGYWAEGCPGEAFVAQEFHTGDMGRLHPDGAVELLGRLDEVLKIGGRKVNPVELELVLQRHPSVQEAAVVGVPDPSGILENVLHAYVVPRPDATLCLADLAAHCRCQLEFYKVPVRIHIRRSLPKSPLGKLLRSELADKASATATLT